MKPLKEEMVEHYLIDPKVLMFYTFEKLSVAYIGTWLLTLWHTKWRDLQYHVPIADDTKEIAE